MKFEISKMVFPVALLVFSVGCGSSNSNTQEEPEQPSPLPSQLAGTWQSECIDSGSGFFRLTFRLTEAAWDLDYDVFGEATCDTQFMTVNIKGPYELEDASKVVEGARDGKFFFEERVVTPHADGAVGFLSGACPDSTFTVGQSTDMLVGCANLGLYPASTCPFEFDIVKLEGGTLNFGARPADGNLCTKDKRPVAVGPPLVKKS